ncbi:hypothetical protein [Gemmobacter sp.]|uniref:hypothetical protein n=1 Tax=Gemmobacter sp. TaxID=1898957 RepID=UPI002AFE93C4|nr:hypothetical protein [Gemmobacter sp.]
MLGLGLGITGVRGLWSPARLFSAGSQGLFLDPSILSSMSQDTAGATPVTGPGQPVGRAMDRSGRGNHATQATAAQRPTYQVDGSGRPYLYFDGVDDGMLTSSVAWGSGEVTVIAAMRKRSDAALGFVLELTTSWSVSAGFAMTAPGNTGGQATYSFRANGSGVVGIAETPASYAAPVTSIVTGQGRIATDTNRIRVNGGSWVTQAADQGTGNYATAPLYIGARNSDQLRASIDLYGLIAINRVLTDAELSRVERYFANRIGVTLA